MIAKEESRYRRDTFLTFKMYGDACLDVIKLCSCSAKLNMKFVLLINPKLITIAKSFLLTIAEHENKNAIVGIFIFYISR